MSAQLITVQDVVADSQAIASAAARLADGALVAFPTETVYGIGCRVHTDSLARLGRLKGRAPGKRYTLHIADKQSVQQYVPRLGVRADKLIKAAWPGPLTVVFELSVEDQDTQRRRLDRDVFESLYQGGTIGIRCPDHPVAAALLDRAGVPVVAPSANRAGQRPAVRAKQVLDDFGDQIDVILDGGPCKHKASSTVVKIGRNGLHILRAGVLSKAELDRISQVTVLFVCTGNTCRSPMAEGLFKKRLAEKLGCEVDDLPAMGYTVISAGTMNMAGLPASAEAVEACDARDVDIESHRSRALSEALVNRCDLIFCMTRAHLEQVLRVSSGARGRCFLLAGNEQIPDPIGQTQAFFNTCAEVIDQAVHKRISELVV